MFVLWALSMFFYTQECSIPQPGDTRLGSAMVIRYGIWGWRAWLVDDTVSGILSLKQEKLSYFSTADITMGYGVNIHIIIYLLQSYSLAIKL
jgi:hypothetical protein